MEEQKRKKVEKIQLPDHLKYLRNLTREEYINSSLGSEKVLLGQIYDTRELLRNERNVDERIILLDKLSALRKELDAPLPPYAEDSPDVNMNPQNWDDIYDQNDPNYYDPYNEKNWKGHTG